MWKFLLLIFCFSITFADNTVETFIPDKEGKVEMSSPLTPEQTASLPSLQRSVFKMIFSLILIVALLYVTYYFLKKMMRGRLIRMNEEQKMKIIEKRALSPKTMLYIIEVEKEKVLIAESQLEIKKLHTLTSLDTPLK